VTHGVLSSLSLIQLSLIQLSLITVVADHSVADHSLRFAKPAQAGGGKLRVPGYGDSECEGFAG